MQYVTPNNVCPIAAAPGQHIRPTRRSPYSAPGVFRLDANPASARIRQPARALPPRVTDSLCADRRRTTINGRATMNRTETMEKTNVCVSPAGK